MTKDDLRIWRAKLDISQKEAGALLGISEATIWGYENGKEIPRAIELAVETLEARHNEQTQG